MVLFLDARIPVLLDTAPAEGDAVVAERGGTLPPSIVVAAWFAPSQDHPPGCTCCVSRSPSAMALAGLFADRARGAVPFFKRVVVLPCTALGAAELRAALDDPLVSSRFRLADDGAAPAGPS